MIQLFKKLVTKRGKAAPEAARDDHLSKSTFVQTVTLAGRVLQRHFWVWPIFAFLLLAAIGYFVNSSIRNSLEGRIQSELQTLLNVECSMLGKWLRNQENNAVAIANNEELRQLIEELAASKTGNSDVEAKVSDPAESEQFKTLDTRIRQLLLPGMAAHRFSNFLILGQDLSFLLVQRKELGNFNLPEEGKEFFKTVFDGQVRVSNPFPNLSMIRDSKGIVRGDVPIIRVAVPIRNTKSEVVACLAFTVRPEKEFMRILQLGKLGKTGETYAITDTGLLISESRFNEDLMLTGLIPDKPDARSLLNLYVRDPGGDLTQGYRPLKRRGELPLTFAAQSAITKKPGVSLEGYRNYRGIRSVSAWQWLEGYNIGVITEMTAAEAFGPLTILQRVFYILFALLTIAFAALLAFSIILSKIRHEARNAAIQAKKLGQYQLDTLLGKGAMGEVYKSKHAMLQRPTAIKLLKSESVNSNAIERFEHEVQLTCKLNNPNTVAIYDYGRTPDGVFYYAMEYLDGINLQDLVDEYGPQPMGRVIHILIQIAGSLYEAHSLGLVHRDIKPANIMINKRGGECDVVKVLDFGLVRSVSESGDTAGSERGMAGTPMYMSPEAIQYPKSVDVRSDIYSLGAVGYFLLTGEPLYQVSSLGELFQQHIEHTPDTPSERSGIPFPKELDEAIMACLQKSRSSRPQSAKEFAQRLQKIELTESWTRIDSESWWMQYEREAQEEQQQSEFGSTNTATRPRIKPATIRRPQKAKTLRSYDVTVAQSPDTDPSTGSDDSDDDVQN